MLTHIDKYIILSIFHFLKGRDIFNIIKTSKKFLFLKNDDFLWKKLLKVHYNWNLNLVSYIKKYFYLYIKITNSLDYCFICNKHTHFYNYIVLCSCYNIHNSNLINIHKKCMLELNYNQIVSRIDPEILYFVINCPLCNNLSRCFICTAI